MDPPAATGAGAPAPSDDDMRTLWVEVDDHGIRKKDWCDVVVESWHEPFAPGEGQKLRGPSTVPQLLRVLEPDPRSWLETWRLTKRLELNDRVMHELNTLIDANHWVGIYDCLSMPSLLSFEILVWRIYQVTDAYSVPGHISWANSKYYRGVAAIDEVVPSEMRSYVNRESRTEVELATARARQQALSSGHILVAEEEDAGGSSLPPGDGPAAPARGGGYKRGGGRGAGGKAGAGKTRTAQPAAQGA